MTVYDIHRIIGILPSTENPAKFLMLLLSPKSHLTIHQWQIAKDKKAKVAFDMYQNSFLLAGLLLCSSIEIIENQTLEA